MAERYISIKQILDDVLDHELLSDLKFERAINYTVNFIRLVGCPRIFIEKTELIDIEDYRGLLPCDFESVIQVRTMDKCGHRHGVFRHTTDSFHMSPHHERSFDLTYKIQGNVIFTSIKHGKIEMAYNAFMVDDDGYPMIPDNTAFINALELYIKKQYFTVLFDRGKLDQRILQNTQQEYAWAVGQAQTDMISPTIDQMQAITNSLNTLIPRMTEHRRGFKNNGTMERWRSKP